MAGLQMTRAIVEQLADITVAVAVVVLLVVCVWKHQ